jgi:hypothetical protein
MPDSDPRRARRNRTVSVRQSMHIRPKTPSPGAETQGDSGLNLDSSTKLVGALAVACYGIGLLIVNAYLLPYDASDFNLFRARFIFVGLLFLATTVLATACPIAGANLLRAAHRGAIQSDDASADGPSEQRIPWVLRADLVFVAMLFFVAPFLAFKFAFKISAPIGLELYVVAGVLGGIILFGAFLYRARPKKKGGPGVKGNVVPARNASGQRALRLPHWINYSLLGFFFVPYVFLMIVVFSSQIYPRVPEELGGAKPRSVQLAITHVSVAAIRQLGVPMSGDANDTTASLRLLFRGEDFYLVQSANGSTFVISKTVVTAEKSDGKSLFHS